MCAIYKKQVSLGQFFKKGEDIKDGDIVEIANEGKKQEGQYGEQDIFLVKKGDEEGNVSFNQTSINNLIDGYGEDSINWIGKKAKVMMIKMSVSGKIRPVYYFLHPDSILNDETGEFSIVKNTQDDIPVLKNTQDDIPVIEEYPEEHLKEGEPEIPIHDEQ